MTSQSTFDRQPLHSAFVGRERELAELRTGLDDASAGHGRVFLLSGEPGIGKTRLAEEISNDAAARGTTAPAVPIGVRHHLSTSAPGPSRACRSSFPFALVAAHRPP